MADTIPKMMQDFVKREADLTVQWSKDESGEFQAIAWKQLIVEVEAFAAGLLSLGVKRGDYIKKLYSLFYHDDKKIYNLKDNADILSLFSEMKQDLTESKWDNVLRKALKETKMEVNYREAAFKELKAYFAMAD